MYQLKRGFPEDCLEMYESRADHLNNNLRLNEISIFIFLQFYCKVNRNQLEIVGEATYEFFRKKPTNEAFQV